MGSGWVPGLDKPYRDLGGVLQSLINLKDFLTEQQDVQNLLDWEIRVGGGIGVGLTLCGRDVVREW